MSRNQPEFFRIPDPIDYRSQEPIVTNENSMPGTAGCMAGASAEAIQRAQDAQDDWERSFDNY